MHWIRVVKWKQIPETQGHRPNKGRASIIMIHACLGATPTLCGNSERASELHSSCIQLSQPVRILQFADAQRAPADDARCPAHTIDICHATQDKIDAEEKLKAFVVNQAARVKSFQDKQSKGYPSPKQISNLTSSTSWDMMSSPQPTEAFHRYLLLQDFEAHLFKDDKRKLMQVAINRKKTIWHTCTRAIFMRPNNEQRCCPTGECNVWEQGDATWSFDDGLNYEPLELAGIQLHGRDDGLWEIARSPHSWLSEAAELYVIFNRDALI